VLERYERSTVLKVSDGVFRVQAENAPPFLQGGKVQVRVSQEEKERMINERPVTRGRFAIPTLSKKEIRRRKKHWLDDALYDMENKD